MPQRMSGLWVPPDSFDPATFTLSDQPVQAVETAATNPKIRMDATGFYATDSAGNKIASINPDGTGTFSGHLYAKSGLDIDEASMLVTPGGHTPNIHAVEWLRNDGSGLIASRVYGVQNSQVNYQPHELFAEAIGDSSIGIASQGAAMSTVRAFDDGGGFIAELRVKHNMGTNGYNAIEAQMGNIVKLLGDSSGFSDFLGLTPRGTQKLAFGVKVMNWPGGVTDLSTTVAHGLGVLPGVVQLTSGAGASVFYRPTLGARAFGTVNFTLDLSVTTPAPANGTTDPVNWIAIG